MADCGVIYVNVPSTVTTGCDRWMNMHVIFFTTTYSLQNWLVLSLLLAILQHHTDNEAVEMLMISILGTKTVKITGDSTITTIIRGYLGVHPLTLSLQSSMEWISGEVIMDHKEVRATGTWVSALVLARSVFVKLTILTLIIALNWISLLSFNNYLQNKQNLNWYEGYWYWINVLGMLMSDVSVEKSKLNLRRFFNIHRLGMAVGGCVVASGEWGNGAMGWWSRGRLEWDWGSGWLELSVQDTSRPSLDLPH